MEWNGIECSVYTELLEGCGALIFAQEHYRSSYYNVGQLS